MTFEISPLLRGSSNSAPYQHGGPSYCFSFLRCFTSFFFLSSVKEKRRLPMALKHSTFYKRCVLDSLCVLDSHCVVIKELRKPATNVKDKSLKPVNYHHHLKSKNTGLYTKSQKTRQTFFMTKERIRLPSVFLLDISYGNRHYWVMPISFPIIT